MSSTIKCPKCTNSLEPTNLESIPVDRCPSCQGIWFDEKELQAVLTRSHNFGRKLGTERPNPGLNQKRGKCPRDQRELLRAFSSTDERLVLDMCPDCHGLWLDGGELHRLIKAMEGAGGRGSG